jgi:N-acetylated-alpha-linked acidic dipeptidase
MRRFSRPLLPLLAATLLLASADEPRALVGFTPERARLEGDWESKFKAIPEPDSLRSYLRHLAARPHNLGSPYGRANAEWLAARFAAWGWQASIDSFLVLFPTPKERIVELVAPTRFKAALQEPTLAADPTSGQRSEQLPTYNAYSIDGDVTAPLVYVNYGMPADYQRLDRMGISVKGAIVLARYGAGWRGLKPKLAAEHGAVGCLIYSDPRDDGYTAGDPYPAGAYRPKDGVQRGSVLDMPVEAGDPLTPNMGARANARRLPTDSAPGLTRIPVLPLSWGDAAPLLSALGGPVAPEGWRGGLPFTYHVGPGPAQVHLKVAFNWKLVPAYDVVARLEGADSPGEWIMRGNHHDGWVNGAEDPISGLVAELEEARALGDLVRQGWQPRRTIIYLAWDGEEPGLLGSTEWVEAHADELKVHGAVYINTDGNGRGYLDAAGSHSLERLVNEVARDVKDPETGLSVWQRLQRLRVAQASSPEERAEARSGDDLRIGALGSGSDFTPFLQHAGVATLGLGFGGEGGGGVYHSIYDSPAWYERFDDTSFVYGRALAQTVGTTVMRLADADVLPFRFGGTTRAVQAYLVELRKLVTARRDSIVEQNREVSEGVFSAIADPRERSVPPALQVEPPYLNFAPLENAVAGFATSAARYDSALARATAPGTAAADPAVARSLDAALVAVEPALLSPAGLPGRPWYRHQLYAPGLLTGYGVKTVPGVREAIEASQWEQADSMIIRAADAIQAAALVVDSAASLLAGQQH